MCVWLRVVINVREIPARTGMPTTSSLGMISIANYNLILNEHDDELNAYYVLKIVISVVVNQARRLWVYAVHARLFNYYKSDYHHYSNFLHFPPDFLKSRFSKQKTIFLIFFKKNIFPLFSVFKRFLDLWPMLGPFLNGLIFSKLQNNHSISK